MRKQYDDFTQMKIKEMCKYWIKLKNNIWKK